MTQLQRGMRGKLAPVLDPAQEIVLEMQVQGGAVYDYSCFGIDAAGKLSDDRYMVFYNQPQSPAGEIRYAASGQGARYVFRLAMLPQSIQKLVFTVSIDGNGTMGQIASHTVSVSQNGQEQLRLALTGADFKAERAIISLEIYRKDVWRYAAVASGFNGGLGDLLRFFGGEEAEDAPAQPSPAPAQPSPAPVRPNPAPVRPNPAPVRPNPAPVQQNPVQQSRNIVPVQNVPVWGSVQPTAVWQNPGRQMPPQNPRPASPAAAAASVTAGGKISLEKKLASGAPQLVSLAKPIMNELERCGLSDEIARVALVLDISGSMTGRYRNGTVQEIVNKTLPLAVQFDDDGALDFWYYGTTCRKMEDVTMRNYQSAVPADWNNLMRTLGGCNNEPAVMQEIIDEYRTSRVPAYVLFVTDGGVGNTSKIKKLLTEASHYPIFWQFIGVGGSGYGVLEQLDNMRGRFVDNANFFALDDFRTVPDAELYRRLLAEFPLWLREVRRLGMIR